MNKKPKYPQPHSIKIKCENPALEERLIEYLHAKSKYEAKYQHSKRSKRMFR